MDYILTDLKGIITNPKETFKGLINNDIKWVLFITAILTGVIMALKRTLEINKSFEDFKAIAVDMVQHLANKDGSLAAAWFLPVGLIILWHIIAIGIDAMSEKMGSSHGEFSDIHKALGYLLIFIFLFELTTLPLILMMFFLKIYFLNTIITILQILFYIWLFYTGSLAVETIYQVPMSYGFIIFTTVTTLTLLIYFIAEWLIGSVGIASLRREHYSEIIYQPLVLIGLKRVIRATK